MADRKTDMSYSAIALGARQWIEGALSGEMPLPLSAMNTADLKKPTVKIGLIKLASGKPFPSRNAKSTNALHTLAYPLC